MVSHADWILLFLVVVAVAINYDDWQLFPMLVQQQLYTIPYQKMDSAFQLPWLAVTWLSEPGAPPLSRFWQISSPYLNKGADYSHRITTYPPDFQNFLQSCLSIIIINNVAESVNDSFSIPTLHTYQSTAAALIWHTLEHNRNVFIPQYQIGTYLGTMIARRYNVYL